MTLAPWEYLFKGFNQFNFHDLFRPTWVAALSLLVALVVLYNIRTRQLHRHPPYLELYEWLLWTGIVTFSLVLIFAVFAWDFLFVLLTVIGGCAVFAWVRFVRFPPILASYETRLAKQRYFSRLKYAHPESTIRPKATRSTRTARAASSRRPRKRR